VICREHLDSAADDIDMDDVDQLFFITRNPVMPPIARLDARQAAVAFMLGESIQTSAGDPDAAGESIRVVGTNPFIVGPEGEEGNRFYELVAENDCSCFVINTGHVGPAKADIGVRESVQILTSIARGELDWEHDERLDLELPTDIPNLDLEAFYPPTHYDDFDAELRSLRAERREYLDQFDTLDPEIKDAVY
jgi:phosphoenolpyruvate carboxykinase (ATP)